MSELTPESRQPSSAPESGDRLESWKEIAAHLKRDVSTAQRWEKKEGLPIHRLPHDKVGSVFAFRPELDAWVTRGIVSVRLGLPMEPALARSYISD
jgi:hypothetical protein